jgi:hypothetical protein
MPPTSPVVQGRRRECDKKRKRIFCPLPNLPPGCRFQPFVDRAQRLRELARPSAHRSTRSEPRRRLSARGTSGSNRAHSRCACDFSRYARAQRLRSRLPAAEWDEPAVERHSAAEAPLTPQARENEAYVERKVLVR